MLLERITRPIAQEIKTSRELEKLLRSGAETSSGAVVTPQTSMQVIAVQACVRAIAETLGQLPLIVYKRDGRSRERATGSNLYRLLHDAPNQNQTSLEFREMLTGHAVLRGNGYAFINRITGGRIQELLPLHPDWVDPEEDRRWNVTYKVSIPDGDSFVLRADQVFHLRGISNDGVKGISPIQLAREGIGHTISAERFGATLFRNGAKMSGILSHPGRLKDEDVARRIRESFDEATSGNNVHKTALIEEGMEWTKVGMTAEDAQFLETRKFQIIEIARLFRVPPHMIGELDRATFNNIYTLSIGFVTYTLGPWLKRWEQTIQKRLMPIPNRENLFAEHLVEGLLRGDPKSRSEFYHAGINDGWMSPNEAREKENMNPREGGDEFLTPLNMRSTDDEDEGGDNEDADTVQPGEEEEPGSEEQ